MHDEFLDAGFNVAGQGYSELLLDYYLQGEFKQIISFSESADVFQDIPFSLKHTYKYVDEAFPNSKFILSVRDSAEQWYSSLVNFHKEVFSFDGTLNSSDLKLLSYRYKGFAYSSVCGVYKTSDYEPYHKETLIRYYNSHNESVLNYFKYRKNDLLVVNLSKKEDYKKFKKFVGIKNNRHEFFHSNKTKL